MAIRFDLFSDMDASALQKRFEGAMLTKRIERKDIIKLEYHPYVNHASNLINMIIVFYDDNKPKLLTEDEQRLQDTLSKKHSGPRKGRSGPRKGMKRGPYKKTRDKLIKERVDLGRIAPNNPPVMYKKEDLEKDYYDKLDMVVSPPRKQVRETDQY
jgi:hypothetical protein